MNDEMNPEMMGDQPEAETVTCLHIYLKPDGTAMVSSGQEPMPEDGTPAASLDEAFQIARQLAENPSDAQEQEAMSAAQAGYAKRAPKPMNAPNPEAVFGE
jgi:hypothetical protein